MKKLTIVAALAIAAVGFTSCGNSGAPKEELKSDVDSLSYAFGSIRDRTLSSTSSR